MAEPVILQSPSVLLLCGAALFFCIFDISKRASRGWCTILSAILALLAAGFDLLSGADLREAAALLTVFMLLNMGVKE
jgi:lysylphosphatidylglycerol synthetase-like protein (DUF2156 family)